MFPLALYSYLILELFAVAYLDIKFKKIVNIWSLLNLVLYGVLLIVYPSLFHFNFSTFFYPISFLMVGFILFVLKVMGGGDSKFLFSFFLLVPEIYHEMFFIKLIYSTVAIGSFLLVYNTTQHIDKIMTAAKIRNYQVFRDVYGTKFAYAPVVALSWILFGIEIREKLGF